MSSAYAASLTCTLLNPIPVMSVLCLMSCKRGSSASRKREGESGQPCLMPCWRVSDSEREPFIAIHAAGFAYNAMTILMKSSPRSKDFIHWFKKGHETLSNAFSASRVIATAGVELWFAFDDVAGKTGIVVWHAVFNETYLGIAY